MEEGDRLGRYQLDLALGSVWIGRDVELDRKVALELIAPTQLRAARALARLRHPNIVAVYDVAAIDGRDAIVMEMLAGETLTAWRERAVPARREMARVLVAVGRALEAAHEVGVAHGAVAAERVRIEASGRVVVFGFRLARSSHAPDDDGSTQATRPALAAERAEPKPTNDDDAYVALVRAVLPDAPDASTVAEMVAALDVPDDGPRRGVSWTTALALAATIGAIAGVAALTLRDETPPQIVARSTEQHEPVFRPKIARGNAQVLGPLERARLMADVVDELARDPSAAGTISELMRGGLPTLDLVRAVLTHRTRAVATALLLGARRDIEYSTTAEMFSAVTGREVESEYLDADAAGHVYEWWTAYSGTTILCRMPIEPRVRALHSIAYLVHDLEPDGIAAVAATLEDPRGICPRLPIELLDIAIDDEMSRPGAVRLAAELWRRGRANILAEAMQAAEGPPMGRMLALTAMVLAGEPFPFAQLSGIYAASGRKDREVVDRLRFVDAEFSRACRDAWSKQNADGIAICRELLPQLRTGVANAVLKEHLRAVARADAVPAWRDALKMVYGGLYGEAAVPAGIDKWDVAELEWRTKQEFK